jgi:hypothetical protein
MLRKNWRSRAFWRWWWSEGIRRDIRFLVIPVLISILVIGGYFAASGLTSAKASDSASSYILETTVQKIVTVREHGRTVVKRMPVIVRRTIVKNHTSRQTIVDTRVVTTPGGVHYVTRKVLRYVPVIHKRVVRVNGKTTTVTETRLVPTVKTQTLTNVVTNQQTVTNVVNHSETVVQPVTSVVTKTETLPQDTVTVTKTQTQTETATVTETVTTTQTVTEPSITITVGG